MYKSCLFKPPFDNFFYRHFCDIIRQEFTVQTFCDINVNVPYNVRLKPLDVHKYHNCDLLRIELHGVASRRKTVQHLQDGNNIKIFASNQDYEQDAVCCIRAPVKANLNVTARGNINAGVFSGSKLILKSEGGSIFVDKFQGDMMDLSTENGDIILKGAVVASNIKAVVGNTGSIKTKRMQGLNALLQTHEGNIIVESSYCDSGTFEAHSGDLDLQNIHKSSKIVLRNGRLNLISLDGQVEAQLQNAGADIQISRILADSRIVLTQNGELNLRLSDDCQETTTFEIVAKEHTLDPSIRLIPSENESTLYLTPTVGEKHKTVYVECEKGPVHITNASWISMLKLDVKK